VSAFPFDAVVGQDDAKLALRLAAADRRIGGVLLRGEKGSAKTTLARGFAALLGDVPFVELPLGATEDRVVGSLDTRAALVGGEIRFQPGLLSAAHGGLLYVDEINLLADHLVDVLLDVAVSGINVVERDGVSHRHPAQFVLVGSMNPEEGELRPQLLDRFGLCVEVRAPADVGARVESVRRRLEFDATGDVGVELVARSAVPPRAGGVSAALTDDVLEAASQLALQVGAEGLRADIVLCRAAAALAALEGRDKTDLEDVRRVAPLALAHRSRRGPFDPPVVSAEELERAVRDALDGGDTQDAGDDDGELSSGDAPDRPLILGSARRPPVPPSRRAPSERGRAVGDEAAGPEGNVSVVPTVRALASRRAADRDAAFDVDDLRSSVREARRPRTVVLCVDLSGSMGAPERATAASGTVLGLLGDAYQRRDRVALVGFRGSEAEVVVSPTASVEVARNQLDRLTTGGRTPLAEGILTGLQVASAAAGESDVLLALLTDGRATAGADAYDRAVDAAAEVAKAGVPAIVFDCESGAQRLGLATALAEAMGAAHVHADDLQSGRITAMIRSYAR
jgi:magnesium chelatase subunit D